MSSLRQSPELLHALAIVAPGEPLREGLDRIIKAKMGALIVVGDDPDVLNICSGGFLLDAAFSPQRLSELAKTDGAIILTSDAHRIARANVHLVPDPTVPTTETGTRHRTAERVARSIGVPVYSVSEDMAVVTVYTANERYQLEPIASLLGRCNQGLQTLERYKSRLDEVSNELTALEVEDLVTVRDVVSVLQRTEMVMRIAAEIERYLVELGTDGRLVDLQLRELMAGVDDQRRVIVLDYFKPDESWNLEEAVNTLGNIDTDDLLSQAAVAEALHLSGGTTNVDGQLSPHGYRMLSAVPRLPSALVDRIVDRFHSLPKLMSASVAELAEVPGVGNTWAGLVKDALNRQAEQSIISGFD